MANLYNEFEKRFNNAWFSAGWVEVKAESKEQKTQNLKKDVATLQAELEKIQENIETISLKKLRLSNLAKLYEN